jgi:hypothetical protein
VHRSRIDAIVQSGQLSLGIRDYNASLTRGISKLEGDLARNGQKIRGI